jgi:glyoxylate reductase
VVTRKWTPRAQELLAERFDARLNPDDTPLEAEEILARCQGADVLCPWGGDRLDGAFIGNLPDSIRLIACVSAGTEHIDVAAARARNIFVSNTPDVVTEETADLTFALMLGLNRRLIHGDRLIRKRGWNGIGIDDPNAGVRVWGKTLGIVGLGGIGAAVARRAQAFRMPLLYHGRRRKPQLESDLGAVYCESLDELLAGSQIVSLHCPLTDQTRGMIDAQALSLMQPGAILVNTARGGVVDEAALIEALKNGVIAGAGLDVFQDEPSVSEGLLTLDNVLMSPHIGTATAETRDAMGIRVIDNIETFLRTGRPGDSVGP